VVADVMGKGLPAAMFALMLRGLVRALRDHGRSPRSLLARANDLLYDELSRMEMFITAQVACVDATNRRVVVASAGHCPALVAQGGGGLVAAISPDGLPLGVLAGTVFEEETFELAPGTRCLMYTDGLTETPSAGGGGLYGQKRLMDWLASVAPGTGVEAMKTALVDELARFRNDLPLRDDQTFVIVGG
jgi:serine phosphatase RsbU (regulator of sigma subunit)